MCDGSLQGKGVHLSVYGFDMISVGHLLTALADMGLVCTIHHHSAGPRIFIPSTYMPRLRELVVPHMVPSMMYKLPKS